MNRLILRTIAFVAALLSGGLILAGWMGLSAISRAHQAAMEGAILVALNDVGRSIEAQDRLGITPRNQNNLEALIAAESVAVPMLYRIAVLDGAGATLAEGPASTPEPKAPGELQRPVLNDLGEPIAVVRAVYDSAPVHIQMAVLGQSLLATGVASALVLCLLAALYIRRSIVPLQGMTRAPAGTQPQSAALAELDAGLARLEAELGVSRGRR